MIEHFRGQKVFKNWKANVEEKCLFFTCFPFTKFLHCSKFPFEIMWKLSRLKSLAMSFSVADECCINEATSIQPF